MISHVVHYNYDEAVHVRRDAPGVYPLYGGLWCGLPNPGLKALASGQWEFVTCERCLRDRDRMEPLGMW